MDLATVIENLKDIGFYSVLLPFILVYVLVFAILEKSKIFSKGESIDVEQTKNINSVIAFVFGLFVVASVNTVMYIQNLIINVILGVIFILGILILLGFIFGENYNELFQHKYVKWTAFGLTILTITSVLLNILGFWDWLFSSNVIEISDFGTYFIIIIIGIILYFISK